MLRDEVLTEALEAFCRRMVEGNEVNPTGGRWDHLTPMAQNYVKEAHIGALHAAAQVLTRPAVVTTAAELDALPNMSVVLSADGCAFQQNGHANRRKTWSALGDTFWVEEIDLPATVLHRGVA
jgi:hypothetical protein